MTTVEIAEAASSLAKYARRAEKDPILLTVDGKPVAAIVGLDGLDLETLTLCDDPKFLDIIEKARSRYRKEGGVSSAGLRQRLKKARKPAKKAANSTGEGKNSKKEKGSAPQNLTHQRLRKLAAKHRPTDEYFAGDIERP